MLRLKSVLVICENHLLELVSIMGLLTSYRSGVKERYWGISRIRKERGAISVVVCQAPYLPSQPKSGLGSGV
jgi:hypothetical protein